MARGSGKGGEIGYKRIIVLTVIATTAGILADKAGIIDAIVKRV